MNNLKFPSPRKLLVVQIIFWGVSIVLAVSTFFLVRRLTTCWQLTNLPGIPPSYCTEELKNPPELPGLNIEGMRRRGIRDEVVDALRESYRIVYGQGRTAKDALTQLAPLADRYAEVHVFMTSVAESRWGIVRGRREGNGD